ncbi:phosphopantetheine-binding protein (plasmid) [Sorangium sp. So ce119]|uniref:phosphopantetheine-binding protein n=1 Tax=Sorangium sp. So ce119 TaxID=3133279 RepID=UPI0007793078|nr:hypothetical protein BE11_45510 [Sorangium cellulosum]
MDRQNFYAKLQGFLHDQHRQRHPDKEIKPIADTANLFDSGYVDSFGMVNLILFIEGTLGVEVPIESYQPEIFFSMKTIYETFCPAPA